MSQRPPVNKWLVAASLGFGALMSTIDSSIVNVALPQIRSSVGATVQEITWVGTSYAIALVLIMPLTAFLGRLFGQRRTYLVCLGIFVIGSALCGIAGSLTSLVVFRVLQGLGGGALQPTQQAILRQTFPVKEQGMAMALFSMVVMLGPAVGPTLGGYIIDHWHWSWIFFINLPIGIFGIYMVWAFVHEDETIVAAGRDLAERQRKNIDWQGIALMSIGLSALVYFLEEGNRNDWFESNLIRAFFAVAVVSLVAFVIRELTAPAPAVDLRLFADPVFAAGTLISVVVFAILMGGMFLLPVFMQEFLGFTATQSGIALIPRVLVMVVAMPIVGRLYNQVPPRLFVTAGILLNCLGTWLQGSLTLESGAGDVVAAIMIQGLGFSCLMIPLTTVALSNIPRHRLADAAGLNSLVRQLGGAIGLAAIATLLGNYAVEARASIGAHLTETNPLVQQRLGATSAALVARGMDAMSARALSLASIVGSAFRQSMVMSFDRIFLFTGLLLLLAVPLLVFLKQGAAAPEAETPPE